MSTSHDVLVLGGTSWLGGHVAAEALRRGHDVTCLARGESGSVPRDARFVAADRDDPGAYDDVAGRAWDAVIDMSRQPGQVRSAVRALGAGAQHWTLVSTGSVYADQSVALSEASPLLDPFDGDVAGPEQYGEGKVACEQAVSDLVASLIVRAGLIGGPGDRSDRLGHYVARCALAGEGPVLVPAVPDQPMQVIDVRDLARWVVDLTDSGARGIVHGVGEHSTVGEMIGLSAEVSGFGGDLVEADPSWLLDQDVEQWMGASSLPLWLPASHHGMGMMDDTSAVRWGLQRRPLRETLADVLEDERARGLARPRKAGLTRDDELTLIALLDVPTPDQ